VQKINHTPANLVKKPEHNHKDACFVAILSLDATDERAAKI
jgi:hypothetical protein